MEDVTLKRVWSTKDVATAISVTAVVVFTITLIWSRFLFNENYIIVVDQKHTESVRVLTERLEKKTKRIEEDNLKQWEFMNELNNRHD